MGAHAVAGRAPDWKELAMKIAVRPALAVMVSIALLLPQGAVAQNRGWPWLGVIITDINRLNVQGYDGGGSGAYVTGVEQPGPASTAGLQRHDIIVAVDGRTTLNTRELTCVIQGKRPGDVVSVTVMRGGKPHSITAMLGSWPDSTEFPRPTPGNCGGEPVSGLTVPEKKAHADSSFREWLSLPALPA